MSLQLKHQQSIRPDRSSQWTLAIWGAPRMRKYLLSIGDEHRRSNLNSIKWALSSSTQYRCWREIDVHVLGVYWTGILSLVSATAVPYLFMMLHLSLLLCLSMIWMAQAQNPDLPCMDPTSQPAYLVCLPLCRHWSTRSGLGRYWYIWVRLTITVLHHSQIFPNALKVPRTKTIVWPTVNNFCTGFLDLKFPSQTQIVSLTKPAHSPALRVLQSQTVTLSVRELEGLDQIHSRWPSIWDLLIRIQRHLRLCKPLPKADLPMQPPTVGIGLFFLIT